MVLLLEINLLILNLVAQQGVGEEFDLLVDVTRLLKQLIVHLGDSLPLNLQLLSELFLDDLNFTVMHTFLVILKLLDLVLNPCLFALAILIKLAVKVFPKLLNRCMTLVFQILLPLLVRHPNKVRLDLMSQTFFHILNLIVGFFSDFNEFFPFLLLDHLQFLLEGPFVLDLSLLVLIDNLVESRLHQLVNGRKASAYWLRRLLLNHHLLDGCRVVAIV